MQCIFACMDISTAAQGSLLEARVQNVCGGCRMVGNCSCSPNPFCSGPRAERDASWADTSKGLGEDFGASMAESSRLSPIETSTLDYQSALFHPDAKGIRRPNDISSDQSKHHFQAKSTCSVHLMKLYIYPYATHEGQREQIRAFDRPVRC